MELLKESWATDDGKNRSFTLSPEHIRVFLLDGDTKELEHLTTSAGRTANDSEDADIPVHRDVTYFVVEYFHKVPAYMYRTVKIVQLQPSVYSHPRVRKANLGVSPLYCAAMRDSEQFQRMEAVSQENGKHRPVFGVL